MQYYSKPDYVKSCDDSAGIGTIVAQQSVPFK